MSQQTVRKASAHVITQAVGKLFKVPTTNRGSMEDVAAFMDEQEALPWVVSDITVCPWEVDVAASVYTRDLDCPLLQELIMFPGDIKWVRDTQRTSGQSMWLAFAESARDTDSHFIHALRGYAPTMLVSHVDVADETYRLVALHANTLTKIK